MTFANTFGYFFIGLFVTAVAVGAGAIVKMVANQIQGAFFRLIWWTVWLVFIFWWSGYVYSNAGMQGAFTAAGR